MISIQRLDKNILSSKGTQATQSVTWNEMYKNEKMTWNAQDTNLSSYVPKANVDHTISGQGTTTSTLNYSATRPMWILPAPRLTQGFWWRKGLSVRIHTLPISFPSQNSLPKVLYFYHL